MSTSATETLFNADAEQCVIGAVLIHGKALSRIQDVIAAEDFYLDALVKRRHISLAALVKSVLAQAIEVA